MKRNNAFQEYLSRRFRSLLSGDPAGVPPWLNAVASGEDLGLFSPDDAPWVIHRDFATLVGGVRALLMQALHPGSLAGVRQHSRYQQDALGRLSGTIRWLTVTTFGATTAVADEARRVNRMHERVTGQYENQAGQMQSYAASNERLLLWVHLAFMESFLRSHQAYSRAEIPGGADAYVALWSRSVEPLGLSEVPMSEAELEAALEAFESAGDLTVTADTLDVVSFIRRPPLPWQVRPIYSILFWAAVATLPVRWREQLGLASPRASLARSVTRSMLVLMRAAIGPESPIEEAALKRRARLQAKAS